MNTKLTMKTRNTTATMNSTPNTVLPLDLQLPAFDDFRIQAAKSIPNAMPYAFFTQSAGNYCQALRNWRWKSGLTSEAVARLCEAHRQGDVIEVRPTSWPLLGNLPAFFRHECSGIAGILEGLL